MYLSYMIQDKMDFKSKWVPITRGWEGARVGTVLGVTCFPTVFTGIGSHQHGGFR